MLKWNTMTGLIVALSLGAGAGCYYPIGGEHKLNYHEARKVSECRDTLLYTGRHFVETKLENLEECAGEINDVLIRYANGGFYNDYHAQRALEWAYFDVCMPGFYEIGHASNYLVKKTAYKCDYVQDIVLTGDGDYYGDPLGWKQLAYELCQIDEAFCPYDIEDFAGLQCGAKELLVDAMIGLQLPRSLNTYFDIGPGFPNIFLEVAHYLHPACTGMETCDVGAEYSLSGNECLID